MKRNLKIVSLSASLALCLLLTGCYIAPDDVNQGNAVNTVNNRPFNTLAPTSTVNVTPDTVSVTPTPDSTWSGWDSVGSATATPTGSTIVFDNNASPAPTNSDGTIALITSLPPTSTPTQAPVTPSPTPPSLQRGFTGSDAVRAVQRRLKELGYYSGAADGDFGPATEKAVKEFQKANGLSADGKVGEKTLKKMNAKTAISYKEAHATAAPKKTTAKPTSKATATPKPTKKVTATPKPTATPNLNKDYYLSIGSKGSRVETLQRRLIELGWLDGKVTGNYDASTEAAVIGFQKKTSGLWADGIAGPDTLRALYSSNAARTTKAANVNAETLEMGSEGSEVRKLQQKLKDLGYLSGSVDGSFGVATEAAVIAFQKNNNLTADGKAGNATQSKLYSGNANRARGQAASISSSKTSGQDTTDIASTGYVTLENGSYGDAVRNLQKKLKSLGYYSGSVDGKFGDSTESAVMAFQLRNDLTVDGKAGPATQRVLYGTSGKSAVSYSALREGDTGSAVRNLQYTLYELGFYDGSIDGKYGQTTADAVRAFQIENSLKPVDGVAGSATLSRLYSSNAKSATSVADQYDTVESGDSGDTVVQVQDCLVQMGYLTTITGVYDAATVAAIRAFQAANGLPVDGKAGQETLQVLFGY